MTLLVARDIELRDLADGEPELCDAATGLPAGVRLVRFLGAGGMAAVFEARLEGGPSHAELSPRTPRRLAVKIMKPHVARELAKTTAVVEDFFKRELVALGRVMERPSPTPFVVACYGSGLVAIGNRDGRVARVPWLAIELVDGGEGSVSLTARVRAERGGLEPGRALGILRGVFEGARVLHAEQIFHRDIKPENVLVVGSIDEEIPKLADCGIARVEGLAGTVGGMTLAYGAPEQRLSAPGVRNPLIGAWTDVHALAAVAWFVLAGEDWCRGEQDGAWMQGERRSLGDARGLPLAYRAEPGALDALDAALRRGAAPRLPDALWTPEARAACEPLARRFLPAMFVGPERFGSVDELAAALLPPLEAVAQRARAAPVRPPSSRERGLVVARERPLCLETSLHLGLADRPLGRARLAAVAEDGRALAIFGDRLLGVVGDQAHELPIAAAWRELGARSSWLLPGLGGGFALVGPQHVLTLGTAGEARLLELPWYALASGLGPVRIEACASDGARLGFAVALSDERSEARSLWIWSGTRFHVLDLPLPAGARPVTALGVAPWGVAALGAGERGRPELVLFAHDGRALCGPLALGGARALSNDTVRGLGAVEAAARVACSATSVEVFVALPSGVLRVTPEGVSAEPVDAPETAPGGVSARAPRSAGDASPTLTPVWLGVGASGHAWLLGTHTVHRRRLGEGAPHAAPGHWALAHARLPTDPALVALGPMADGGARVLDAAGSALEIVPARE
ncbi:MAG: protein kinase [Myxococcales bacterium]|nr:protein kinase [Myxococcales bacterium]